MDSIGGKVVCSLKSAAKGIMLCLILCAATQAWANTGKENPVTGETEIYVNTFSGVTTEWNETTNWDTSTKPFIESTYSPALVVGKTASTSVAIDGWTLRVGAYNGANVTWSGGIRKIQASSVGCWLTADETSSITIASFAGKQLEGSDSAPFKLTSANAGGITWSAGLTSTSSADNQKIPFWYYLKGTGTVVYGGDVTVGNAQVIKQADITLTGTSRVASKTLVTFGSGTTKAFTADAIIKVMNSSGEVVATKTLKAVTSGSTTLTVDDKVGTCELVQTSTGISLYYVDGDASNLYKPSININFTNESNNGLTTSVDVGLEGYAVPGTVWNNYVVNNSTFNAVNSINTAGVASNEAGVSVTISGTRGSHSCSSLDPAKDLRHGYIDENGDNMTPTVTVTGIPYHKYRVIVYHSTDTANVPFGYDTINGTNYTYVDNTLTEGEASWGNSGADKSANAISEGGNVLLTGELSGSTLTVVGHRNGGSSSARGCIAAIQIVEREYILNLDGTATNWSEGEWKVGKETVSAPTSGPAKIIVSAPTTLTIDENLSLNELCIVSEDSNSSLVLNVAEGVTATIGTYDCSQAQGRVTLNISQGSATITAGSDTVLNGLGAGAISIPDGNRLTISESGMRKSQLTNNGTLHIVGGSEATPIEIYDDGAANTGMGAITLAANAYVRNNATSGNKLYTITGAVDASSTLVLSSGQNWGMTDGTQIRNCKVLVRDRDFWWERTSAFDKTVDLDYGAITLHLGNPDTAFEIGSLTGSGSISKDKDGDALTINADRIDGVLSYALNNIPLTVKGSHVQTITSATGSINVDGGIVRLGSQTVSSLQNGGTVKYEYSAKPTIQIYSGIGVLVVDMTGVTLVAGTQYHVVDIAGVTVDKVSVIGVDDDSFQLYAVANGVVLADESPSAAIWTGDSGIWTDSNFDGKTIATDEEPVAFADAWSGAESVTVTLDGPKTVESASFTANTTAYELIGDVLTGPISLSGTAPVTFKVAPIIGNAGLTGTGPLVLDFGENSIFTMSQGNTAYAGEAIIASGTVKMGNAKSFGNFGRAASIRVKSGATLDANGASNGGSSEVNNKLILESGSSFSNSVSLSDNKFFAFYDLTLEGNATIVADTANNGLTRHYNSETYVHLGANTLTKTGSNTFYMSAPTIDGTGTIDVVEGVLSIARAYLSSTQPTFPNGTIRVRTGATLTLQNYNGGANLSAKKIIVEGTGRISGTGSVSATDGIELRTVNGGVSEYPTLVNASTAVSATGSGTLAFGEVRPDNTVSLEENVGISVKKQNSADSVIQLKLSRDPASVTVYDESGNVCENAESSYDADSGILTIKSFTIEVSEGTIDFDDVESWNGGSKPSSGDKVTIIATGNATLSVANNYSLSVVTVKGGGAVSFSGNGSIAVDDIALQDGSTLTCNANISATTSICLGSGTVLKLNNVTGSATISGEGSVETYGNVDMAALNTFTGGITVKTGTLTTSTASTSASPWCTGFGPYQTDWDNAGQKAVTVEDGACIDLRNVIDHGIAYKLTIAGKGIESDGVYSGAVKYTGDSAQGYGVRQLSNIALSGDALIDLGPGWGLVHNGYGAAALSLNGHALTIRGSNRQNFPMQNVTVSAGTIILENSTLQFGMNQACNLTGVTIVAKGGSKLDFDKAPTAIGSVVIAPSATDSVAVEGYAMMSGKVVPVVKTSYIDSSALTAGGTITLMTTDATLTEGENVTIVAGSRYTTSVSGQNVTAIVRSTTPGNFMHYDFNAANSIAADSTYNFGNLNPIFADTRNGRAGTFNSDFKPYYGSNTSKKSPFYAGEMSVTTLLKPMEANNTILWNFGNGWGTGMALIAKDDSTLAVVSWTGGAAGSDVVSLSEISDLMNNWHLVTIVANSNGTTLYVDDKSASVSTVLPYDFDGKGQFGSIHGTAKNYNAVSGAGYLLDDWRVYDVTLTAEEVRRIKKELLPVGTIFSVY